MRKRAVAVVTVCLLVATLAACESNPGKGGTKPSPSVSATEPANVVEHESGPQSPIAYGLQVPRGATQLGPLLRYRSTELIAEYQPELDAALDEAEAKRAVKEAEALAEAQEKGDPPPTPTPTTPTTPSTRPSDDTFSLLDNPPRPDTTVSLMRIDGQPTEVVQSLLAQIASLLPDNDIVVDDLSAYCSADHGRIKGCKLNEQGATGSGRELKVNLSIDPGNVSTRTSAPAAQMSPVMSLRVAYVGDPRAGQLGGEPDEVDNVPDKLEPDVSGLIWPKMDLDSPPTSKLLDGWTIPEGASIVLSGYSPAFAAIATADVREADRISEAWVTSVAGDDVVQKDVVEDLNEISTTYRVTLRDGTQALASNVLSARGSYAMMFYTPGKN